MASTLPFIGLHYWAGSGRAFDGVAALLAPDYRLLAPDLPGFGAAPSLADASVAAYTDHVAHFIARQHLRGYVLVGHSMGGKIALNLAARQPAGLAGVVLLSPSPPGPEPMSETDRQAALRAYGHAGEAEKTLHKITARPLPEAIQEQIVQDNLRTSRAAWDAWLRQGSREDISADMDKIRVPCLVLVGDQDPVLSAAVQRTHTLPLLPPGTTLQRIPGAGHLLPYEAPEAVAALLRAFERQRHGGWPRSFFQTRAV